MHIPNGIAVISSLLSARPSCKDVSKGYHNEEDVPVRIVPSQRKSCANLRWGLAFPHDERAYTRAGARAAAGRSSVNLLCPSSCFREAAGLVALGERQRLEAGDHC